jgi:DnaJ domain
MRDPYHILGISRGAGFDDIKTAYRRASKTAHPDMGGSHEAMTELNAAYSFALNELKQGYADQHDSQYDERKSHSESKARGRGDSKSNSTEDTTRDIDEELEALRKASERYEQQLRAKRQAAWDQGKHITWAKMSWEDFFGFFTRISQSGLKGRALLAVAAIGAGTLLLSFCSMQSPKPQLRLAPTPLPVIVIPAEPASPPKVSAQDQPAAPLVQKPKPLLQSQPPPPPEERTLIASDGAKLKLANNVIYHLKLRVGRTTVFRALEGAFKIIDQQSSNSICVDHFEIAVPQSPGPYVTMDSSVASCEGDSLLGVQSTE